MSDVEKESEKNKKHIGIEDLLLIYTMIIMLIPIILIVYMVFNWG